MRSFNLPTSEVQAITPGEVRVADRRLIALAVHIEVIKEKLAQTAESGERKVLLKQMYECLIQADETVLENLKEFLPY